MGATGCLAQVQAVANQSLWLDVSPECTFFQQSYCRHSPFAICETDIAPQSGIAWGKMLQFEVPRAGDLLAATLLKLKVKGLRFLDGGNVSQPANASLLWVNALGHAAIREVQLEIGQVLVDKFSGRFMEILEQHRASVGNEQGKSIGSFLNGGDLQDWSYNDQVLHIALHFFFFEHPEMYLPIIALSAHPVRIKVYLREKADLINMADEQGTCLNPLAPGNLDTVFNGDLVDAALVARMVFLDQFERNLVSAEVHEIVMLEHQEDNSESIQEMTAQKSVTLSFNNAVLALFTTFNADKDTLREINGLPNCNKDWFNWCVPRPADEQPPYNVAPATPLGVIPFATWQIKFNGSDRVTAREAEYFSEVMPFLHATKKSLGLCVMSYYFHLSPLTSYQTPAGHAMFSRIHEVKSSVVFRTNAAGGSIITTLDTTSDETIAATVGEGTWSHYCLSYNVLRISMGQAIKKFS